MAISFIQSVFQPGVANTVTTTVTLNPNSIQAGDLLIAIPQVTANTALIANATYSPGFQLGQYNEAASYTANASESGSYSVTYTVPIDVMLMQFRSNVSGPYFDVPIAGGFPSANTSTMPVSAGTTHANAGVMVEYLYLQALGSVATPSSSQMPNVASTNFSVVGSNVVNRPGEVDYIGIATQYLASATPGGVFPSAVAVVTPSAGGSTKTNGRSFTLTESILIQGRASTKKLSAASSTYYGYQAAVTAGTKKLSATASAAVGESVGEALWTPAVMYQSPQVYSWLDFSDSANIQVSGGVYVSATDKSGQGHPMTHYGTQEPKQVTVNGRTAMQGVSNNNVCPFIASTYAYGYMSVVMVWADPTLSEPYYARLMSGGAGASDYNSRSQFDIEIPNVGQIQLSQNGNYVKTNYSGGGLHLLTFQVAPTLSISVDGSLTPATATPSQTPALNYYQTTFLGSINENYSNTLIGEVVILRAASQADLQNLEGYMAWKWGIQNNLPSNHPYALSAPLASSQTKKLTATGSAASGANLSGSAATKKTVAAGSAGEGAGATIAATTKRVTASGSSSEGERLSGSATTRKVSAGVLASSGAVLGGNGATKKLSATISAGLGESLVDGASSKKLTASGSANVGEAATIVSATKKATASAIVGYNNIVDPIHAAAATKKIIAAATVIQGQGLTVAAVSKKLSASGAANVGESLADGASTKKVAAAITTMVGERAGVTASSKKLNAIGLSGVGAGLAGSSATKRIVGAVVLGSGSEAGAISQTKKLVAIGITDAGSGASVQAGTKKLSANGVLSFGDPIVVAGATKKLTANGVMAAYHSRPIFTYEAEMLFASSDDVFLLTSSDDCLILTLQ